MRSAPWLRPTLLAAALVFSCQAALAQDFQEPRQKYPLYETPFMAPCLGHSGSSPFNPPQPNDQTFVVDSDFGLDTGCTFKFGGPLFFTIEIKRVVGDVQQLKANGMISEFAELSLPAFDVDFDAIVPPYAPERDRIFFNGHLLSEEYLTGSNNVWKLNTFRIPIEWVNFPSDPGDGNTPTAAENYVRIDIDVANSEEVWCTAIDWAALKIEVVRPVVLAHGILSDGSVWNDVWIPGLQSLGIKYGTPPNNGNLDSIANNAQKIATKVAELKERLGVDKVVLVGHSKGGLDSRHYAENSEDVEQILQLGTPNGGSPLADAVQAGTLYFAGLPLTVVINVLAGPAGVQLTTPYMSFYNGSHGSNPNVVYTALAGDYDPGTCGFFDFGCLIDQVLLGITGPGDTIVPIWSVHALPYTANRIMSTFGADQQSKHTSIEKSQTAFNIMRDRVKRLGTPLQQNCPNNSLLVSLEPVIGDALPGKRDRFDNYSSSEAGGPAAMNRSATVAGVLSQGQTQSGQVAIDAGIGTGVVMFYPSGVLDMALISPGGLRYDRTTIPTLSGVGFVDQDILGGRVQAISFADMPTGVWSVEVTGTNVVDPSGTAPFALSAWFQNSPIALTGELPAPSISAGDPLPLIAHPVNGATPIVGATARALVGFPDGTAETALLNDTGVNGDAVAGDGHYGGTLANTTQVGTYRVLFIAESDGTGPVVAFSRETLCLATVSAPGSSFQGGFIDSGIDENGNGFFDQLRIGVNVQVTTPSRFRVFGILEDSNGSEHEASFEGDLPAGVTHVDLDFDGRRLFDNRVSGPYRLARVQLLEVTPLDILPRQTLVDAHTTAPYDFAAFEHSPLRLTGTNNAFGLDTNANSRYDWLQVEVGAEVDDAAFYQWSARLVDTNDEEIGFASGSGSFQPGAATLTLLFDGRRIGEHGVDGPFTVRDLLFFGAGNSVVTGFVFATGPLPAEDFEGFGTDTTPPSLTVILKPRNLWPPNGQLRNITATVRVNDNNDPAPQLRLVSITSNEPDTGPGDDTVGDIQQADFGFPDKEFLLRAERLLTGTSRIYTVVYEVEDASGNVAQATARVMCPIDLNGQVLLPAGASDAPTAYLERASDRAGLPIALSYGLNRAGDVRVAIYDLSGRLVRELEGNSRQPGDYDIQWDGRDGAGRSVPQGLYFVRLEAQTAEGSLRKSLKVAVLR